MNAFGVASVIPFDDISLIVGAAYLLIGGFVGALGSVVSTRKHLNV